MAKGSFRRKADDNNYTWENPEGGRWWHYAGPAGVEVAKINPKEFGKLMPAEEPLPPTLSEKKLIRVAPSAKFVSQWEHSEPGGQILTIDPKKLKADQWFHVERNGNVVVLGEVAAEIGEFQPMKQPLLSKSDGS